MPDFPATVLDFLAAATATPSKICLISEKSFWVKEDASHIFLACDATDFRKQISGLVSIVSMRFKLDPFQGTCVFIFCNKKRDSIKVLRYDKNGFLLATKKLLDGMKFQWPRTPNEVKKISFQQVEWLLQGLKIEQEKAHHPVKRTLENSCF